MLRSIIQRKRILDPSIPNKMLLKSISTGNSLKTIGIAA